MQTDLHKITRYSCQILMKLEFSGQIPEKYSNILKKNLENLCSWNRAVPRGRTERPDEANSPSLRLCERAEKLVKTSSKNYQQSKLSHCCV